MAGPSRRFNWCDQEDDEDDVPKNEPGQGSWQGSSWNEEDEDWPKQPKEDEDDCWSKWSQRRERSGWWDYDNSSEGTWDSWGKWSKRQRPPGDELSDLRQRVREQEQTLTQVQQQLAEILRATGATSKAAPAAPRFAGEAASEAAPAEPSDTWASSWTQRWSDFDGEWLHRGLTPSRLYKSSLCRFHYGSGAGCLRPNACTFAHHVDELQLHRWGWTRQLRTTLSSS